MNKLLFTFFAFVVVSASGVVSSVSAADGIAFQKDDVRVLLKKCKKEGSVLFVACETSWSEAAKNVSSEVYGDKAIGDYVNQNFVATKIDIEKGEATATAIKYNVRYIPTILILDGYGNELGRLESRITKSTLVDRLKAIR